MASVSCLGTTILLKIFYLYNIKSQFAIPLNRYNYTVHVPFQIPKIPNSAFSVFWDNWSYFLTDEPSKQPPPPILHRISALALMFILVFGPSMGYATFGSIYTQVS